MYKSFVQVVINNNSKSTDRIYTYGIRPELEDKAVPGKRVTVNFGRSRHIVDALIVSCSGECTLPQSKIKPVIDVIDDEAVVSEEMIRLCMWIRDRYVCKYSDAVRLVIPAMIKYEHNIFIKVIHNAFSEISLSQKEAYLLDILKSGVVELNKLKNSYGGSDLHMLLDSLREKNIIETESREGLNKKPCEKIISINSSASGASVRTEQQKKVIEYLSEKGKTNIKKLTGDLSVSSSVVNNLIKKNILLCEEVLYEAEQELAGQEEKVTLNIEQQNVCNKVAESKNNVFLLHGVTGSGKTEVYMEIVRHYQKENKQSIVLVPEISLTAQTIERFKKRFGNKIAVFHSRLSKKEKFIQWSRVYNREADIIIGARSAIFAPIKNIGVIIIDEEHEDSYKSSTAPKYDTVEVAIKMSVLTGARVILGTATPSLSTYYKVLKGQIELLEMKNRVKNAIMPDIHVVDMSSELDKGNNTIISERLYESIRASLNNGEQAILFLNKRGYSGFVVCKKCGHVARCDRCDISMTYHLNDNMLHCHYCGRTKKMMNTCSKCGSEKIEQFSAGTQHVERLVNHLFPKAVTERMDVDSMTDLDSYEKIYNNFKNKKTDILIGTQMLAKGLDFPFVTTVGVLSADSILNLPFFDASEKTFQLLTQVSGRAGRGDKRGRVFIQTYEPGNFIINAARSNNYELFLNEELKLRKEFAFPPFINIINICMISRDEERMVRLSFEKYEELKKSAAHLVQERSLLVYRPIPHGIYKVNDEYRINFYLKASNYCMGELKKIIRTVYMAEDIENIKISININTDSI